MTRLIASIRMAVILGTLLSFHSLAHDLHAAENEQLVLLTNGNVLRGLAIPQGDVVILERENGSHIRLQRDQVLHTADSLEALYAYRCEHRTYRNSSNHVEMAKWCLRHGLIAQAKGEVEGLNALDPSHPERVRLERQLAAMEAPRATAEVRSMRPAAAPAPAETPSIQLPEGISSASIAEFATRVQPMLINRCGNSGCHRTGSDTPWQLSHLGVNVRVSAATTQRNINATLPHIKLDDPLQSALLRYATTPHGNPNTTPSGTKPGYTSGGHIAKSAEQTLRQWLSQLGRYPQPQVAHSIGIAGMQTSIPVVQQASNQAFEGNPLFQPVNQANTSADGREAPPKGFSLDTDGEWIYDPDGEFTTQIPAPEPGQATWPEPVLAPESSGEPAMNSANPNPGRARPIRLPTLNDPFSAELFNRQSQRAAASDSLK